MTNSPPPTNADLSDLSEVARFAGISGDDMASIMGLLTAIGYRRLSSDEVVCKRSVIKYAAETVQYYANTKYHAGRREEQRRYDTQALELRAKAGEA